MCSMKQANFGDGAVVGVRFYVCFRHFCLIFASFHRNVWAELGPLLQAIVTVLGAELAVFLIGNAKNQEKAARKAAKRLKKD